MNNNYGLFYKKHKTSKWKSTRLDLSVEQWEDYCKEKGFAVYDIVNFKELDAFHLHLTTDVVLFNGTYYLPDEIIPYPDGIPNETLKIETKLDEDYISDDIDFDEIYSNQSINWGWGELWTSLNTKFITENKECEALIVAQNFLDEIPYFLENLEKNKFTVMNIMEYSKFQWLGWEKDNKIRLIHLDYNFDDVDTFFDVLIDKQEFLDICHKLTEEMKNYADKDLKRYQEYVIKKYGKIHKDSIPYPENELENLGKFKLKTNIHYKDDGEFEGFYKDKEDIYTAVYTFLTLKDKTEEVVIIAEDFIQKYAHFIRELQQIENSVYDDYEYTESKLYGWLKGNEVRLVYQDFSCDEHEIIFDVTVDKKWFFEGSDKLLKQMEEVAQSEQIRYEKYLKSKDLTLAGDNYSNSGFDPVKKNLKD